jgi:hypothetical protein
MESMERRKPRPRRSFTPEFKAEIVELWLESPDQPVPGLSPRITQPQVHRHDLLGGLLHEYRPAA